MAETEIGDFSSNEVDLQAIINRYTSVASSSWATRGMMDLMEERKYFCFDVGHQFLNCWLPWYCRNCTEWKSSKDIIPWYKNKNQSECGSCIVCDSPYSINDLIYITSNAGGHCWPRPEELVPLVPAPSPPQKKKKEDGK